MTGDSANLVLAISIQLCLEINFEEVAEYKCKGTPSLAGNITLTRPACGIPARFLP